MLQLVTCIRKFFGISACAVQGIISDDVRVSTHTNKRIVFSADTAVCCVFCLRTAGIVAVF
jgi:hypothetical protein